MIWLYIVLGILLLIILFYFLPMLLVARHLYRYLLVKTSPDKWGRECSDPDPEQQKMFADGIKWGEDHEEFRQRLEVVSDSFRLIGEYFDFGHDKAVIIIPGRTESCLYSYYFAAPYEKAGYNVLAIDNRSHGLSEGKYDTVGIQEYRDIIAWARLLKEKHGIKSIVLHGICIGAATGINAMSDEEGKKYFDGLVNEGVYIHFGEMMRARFAQRKKPSFPIVNFILLYLAIHAKKSPRRFSPIEKIGDVEKPIFFIYSKEDVFSKKENIDLLYNRCKAPKRLSMFDKGVHSHIRINNMEKYDSEIISFLKDLPNLKQ